MKYIVILEEVTIHRVELDGINVDDAEQKALSQWKEGIIYDDDPYLDSLRVLEIRSSDNHSS